MNVVRKTGFGVLALVALTAIVYAADYLTMKCNDEECGYSTELFFGGTMNSQAITGYCRCCNTFVKLSWPRKSSPTPTPEDAKGTDSEPLKPKNAKGTKSETKIYEIPDLFEQQTGRLSPKDAKAGGPKPIGTVWDSLTGNDLRIYACPNCKGPFAEIRRREDIVHCPDCSKKTFVRDKSKPRIIVD